MHFIDIFSYFCRTKSKLPMLLTTTIVISFLVIMNFLLLKFSCNKTIKVNKSDKKPIVLKSNRILIDINENLAPTGS